MAGIKNFTGSRIPEWEEELERARHTALSELMHRAAMWGANAAVGVAVDVEPVGTILLATATGTAVVVEPTAA
jgi:uncharacterized protein YbjQ (UPF0145 family)